MATSVDAVLPAVDEAAAIPGVWAAFPAGCRPIVVDNGSTDGTTEVAAGCGTHVVSEPQRGFGAACWGAWRNSSPTPCVAWAPTEASTRGICPCW